MAPQTLTPTPPGEGWGKGHFNHAPATISFTMVAVGLCSILRICKPSKCPASCCQEVISVDRLRLPLRLVLPLFLVFAGAGLVLRAPEIAEADFPAADLSTDLLFE